MSVPLHTGSTPDQVPTEVDSSPLHILFGLPSRMNPSRQENVATVPILYDGPIPVE